MYNTTITIVFTTIEQSAQEFLKSSERIVREMKEYRNKDIAFEEESVIDNHDLYGDEETHEGQCFYETSQYDKYWEDGDDRRMDAAVKLLEDGKVDEAIKLIRR